MDFSTVKAFAPATIANLSCGFDVLGLALDNWGDEVHVSFQEKNEVSIIKIEGDNNKLPLDVNKNTCTVGILELLKKVNIKKGIQVRLFKKLPLGSGLGSSASSAVAGIWATNALLGYPLTKIELLPFAIEAERIACGSAHADNVAPSLLGGIILVKGYEPLDVVSIPTDLNIYCSVVHPNLEVNTKDARGVLPKEISLNLATKQWGQIAGLVAGFLKNDSDLIKRSMQDFIVEPARAYLIPHFYDVKKAALENGALGCSISGSGPTMFALSLNEKDAHSIAQKMSQTFLSNHIQNQFFTSKINPEGVKII